MIEKKHIAAIKADVDLVALVQAKGINLKKNGKSWFGLCPFHADKNPSLSINPTKNLWQCFGCGAAGDVIRFVELFDQVDFKEAVHRLSDNGFKRTAPKPKAEQPKPLSVKERKLLARVVSYCQHTLAQNNRGLTYLKQERGIADNQLLKDFGAGYANGTLLEILPDDPEVTILTESIIVALTLYDQGFKNVILIYSVNAPFDEHLSLLHRKIKTMGAGGSHKYISCL
jgi:DNA primase catalytic core